MLLCSHSNNCPHFSFHFRISGISEYSTLICTSQDILLSQVELPANNLKANHNQSQDGACQLDIDQIERKNSEAEKLRGEMHCHPNDIDLNRSIDVVDTFDGNSFLKRFLFCGWFPFNSYKV